MLRRQLISYLGQTTRRQVDSRFFYRRPQVQSLPMIVHAKGNRSPHHHPFQYTTWFPVLPWMSWTEIHAQPSDVITESAASWRAHPRGVWSLEGSRWIRVCIPFWVHRRSDGTVYIGFEVRCRESRLQDTISKFFRVRC